MRKLLIVALLFPVFAWADAAYFELLRLSPAIQEFKDGSGDVKMTEQYLRESVDDAHIAGIDTIIVPYVEYFGYWFYPRTSYPFDYDKSRQGRWWHDVVNDERVDDFNPVDVIMSQAEANGQSVYLGLGRNGDTHLLADVHLVNTGGVDPMRYGLTAGVRLGRAVTRTKQAAQELYALYGNSPALAGWYLSHEISHLSTSLNYTRSVNIVQPNRLFDYGLPIMMAPADTHDVSSASAVNNLLLSGISIVAPQDAVGAGYDFNAHALTFDPAVTISQICGYFQAWGSVVSGVNQWMANSGYSRRLSLWSTTELWQMDGPDYANDYPADSDRVSRQKSNACSTTNNSYYAWLGMVDDDNNSLAPMVTNGSPKNLYEYFYD